MNQKKLIHPTTERVAHPPLSTNSIIGHTPAILGDHSSSLLINGLDITHNGSGNGGNNDGMLMMGDNHLLNTANTNTNNNHHHHHHHHTSSLVSPIISNPTVSSLDTNPLFSSSLFSFHQDKLGGGLFSLIFYFWSSK
ncbi:hypothetical protein CYY_001367 [Polysphondylium violaceum]|uniref:Uncharacterized protein n=1 Tax=Polysphondylium violaceum TaxID=133409 RepID=A0A8J4Q3F9_9MYCE|nr:hypothetical protein CYY_001367 [Polysphondylium violaceum]